jgi:hypothetical protein
LWPPPPKTKELTKGKLMTLKEEQEAIQTLVERMWKDVASLPWTDPGWARPMAQETTRQHYVKSTTSDLLKIVEKIKNDQKNTRGAKSSSTSEPSESERS